VAWGDITAQRLNGEPYEDLAEDTIVRGRAVTFGSDRRTKAWSPGDRVKGIALESAVAGQHVRSAPPGSQVEVENGLLPGEILAAGDPVAVLSSGAFGLADPDNDLPATGSLVDAAVDQAVPVTDPTYQPLVVILDGAMTTGDGMPTIVEMASGDLNGANLTVNQGTIWSGYDRVAFVLPRIQAAQDLFIRSLAVGDTSRSIVIRLVKGPDAAIPFEEVHLVVSTDGSDATTLVNLTSGVVIFSGGAVQPSIPAAGVIGGTDEEPLDINAMSVKHPVTSAGPFEIMTGPSGTPANQVLLEVPSTPDTGGVTRSVSQVAAVTVVGGWEAQGLTFAHAGTFGEAEVTFEIEPFGEFRTRGTRFKFSVMESSQVSFAPFFPAGSATSGTASLIAGTRLSVIAVAPSGVGNEVVATNFGIRMRKLPT
jgi:hypothetical protein